MGYIETMKKAARKIKRWVQMRLEPRQDFNKVRDDVRAFRKRAIRESFIEPDREYKNRRAK